MTTTLQEYSFISDADALEISVLRCTLAGNHPAGTRHGGAQGAVYGFYAVSWRAGISVCAA